MSGGVRPRTRQRFWTPVVPAQATPVTGIRPRRIKDLPAAARLLQLVYYESGYPLTWPVSPRGWLSDPDDVIEAWVVERHGELLGHVAVSRVGRESVTAYRWREMTGRDPAELAAVTRLFVRPRARRQGIGGALLDTAVADLRERGLTPVLQVASTQDAAIGLYRSRDWRLLSMDLWGARSEHRRMHCYTAPPARSPRG